VWTVAVRVAGLATGSTALLVVESPDANVVRTDDARCVFAKARATCQISGANLAPVSLEVVSPQGADVVASLTPATADADATNNTWRARLD
jgi:hypothetical protein